jgi:hypothetical protein
MSTRDERDTFYNGETGMTEYLPPLTERIAAAFNRAADEITVECDLPDEGVRDAMNLLINAGLHYFNHPNATLDAAIEANYQLDDPQSGPLEWIRRAV